MNEFNKNQENINRERSTLRSFLDADSSTITSEDLHKQKLEQDKIYQQRLDQLLKENQDQINFYQQRIEKIEKEHFDKSEFDKQISMLLEEKALQDKLYNEKVNELKAEKEEHEKLYEIKINEIKLREEKLREQKQQQLESLKEEKEHRTRLISSKIEELKLEQQKHESFYKEKIAKLNESISNNELKAERARILEEKANQDQLFENKLAQLEEQKLELDSHIDDEIQNAESKKEALRAQQNQVIEEVENEKALKSDIIQTKIEKLENEKQLKEKILELKEEQLRQEELREQELAEREYHLKQMKFEEEQALLHEEEQQMIRNSEVQEQDLSSSYVAPKSEILNTNSVSKNFRSKDRLEAQRLCRLGDLKDYEVADEDPDIRGWIVFDRDGYSVGEVNELIVDPAVMKVRYLDINLDAKLTNGENRHLLIPIGAASLDEEDDKVFVNNIDSKMLLKCPAYDGGEVTREYENSVRKNFASSYNPGTTQGNFYEHKDFDTQNFYRSKKRKHNSEDDTSGYIF